MKKFASVFLAVLLMLSLSVFSFADCELKGFEVFYDGIIPYSLVPISTDVYFMTNQNANMTFDASYALFNDGIWSGSGACLAQVSDYVARNSVFIGRSSSGTGDGGPVYWWNLIGKFIDANGYVLKSSDFDKLGVVALYSSQGIFYANMGNVDPAIDNLYQFDDGFIQVALNSTVNHYGYNGGFFIYLNVSNSSVVEPISFEVETLDFYMNESTSSKPFDFGEGAHAVTPEGPKDPNDHTQYGSASDQVEWYNDAFGAAVNPELDNKMSSTTSMIEQEQEIEDQMIDGINQYAPSVDPANLTMPTQIVSGLQFIGNTFMSSFNSLGDVGFVISFSMMLGVVLVLIGRGESALARGMASSARERRRTEYSSDNDMKKGG